MRKSIRLTKSKTRRRASVLKRTRSREEAATALPPMKSHAPRGTSPEGYFERIFRWVEDRL